MKLWKNGSEQRERELLADVVKYVAAGVEQNRSPPMPWKQRPNIIQDKEPMTAKLLSNMLEKVRIITPTPTPNPLYTACIC
jgi:hypothetical protein